jgi:hypothetical protein
MPESSSSEDTCLPGTDCGSSSSLAPVSSSSKPASSSAKPVSSSAQASSSLRPVSSAHYSSSGSILP